VTTTARLPVILMAEDDADDRLLARDALNECQIEHDLHCVEDGEDLLDYLHRRGNHADKNRSPRPSLILLDLNMPKKDGREALREIRGDPNLRRIPIVVFTTSSADADVELAYELGANSCVTKPASFDSLVEVMRMLGRYWFNVVDLPYK
jgi:CheY-like chemotaxis protein